MSFICKESDILYIDKELFTYENKEFSERYTTLYRDGHSQGTHGGDTQGTGTQYSASCAQMSQPPCVTEGLRFKGRPYAEIIDEWWKRNGGVPQEGERNVKLYQLAVNLRAICDNNKALLMQVMPRLGLDEQELQSIVESACKESPKGISKPMREIIGTNASVSMADDDMARWLWDWGEQIEALMEDFPLLRDICKGLKRNQYPAAMFVGGESSPCGCCPPPRGGS